MTGERILVVDDGDDIRHSITSYILKPNAYDYLEAKDGMEALEIIRSRPVDLILLDLQMPRMDGMELLRHLRDEGITIPVVLMTMYGSEEIAIEVFRLGGRDYIIKPFSEEDLLGALERALSETRLLQERTQLTADLGTANQDLARQVEQLRLLVEIGRQIVTADQPADVLRRTLQAVVELVSPLEASLLLVGQDRRTLVCAARAAGGNIQLCSEVVENDVALEALGADELRVGGARYNDGLDAFTADLAAPLNVGETLGALSITTLAEALSEHQVTLLSALAVYAAVSLERIRVLRG
jgi:DNA-binding response OmpR family regulator